MFEMIGIKQVQDVILQLSANIKLTNVGKSLFANLTVAANQENSTVYLLGCTTSKNLSKISGTALDSGVMFIMKINGVIFSGVTLNLISAWSTNFTAIVTDSLFDNRSLIISKAIMLPRNCFQFLIVTNCMYLQQFRIELNRKCNV